MAKRRTSSPLRTPPMGCEHRRRERVLDAFAPRSRAARHGLPLEPAPPERLAARAERQLRREERFAFAAVRRLQGELRAARAAAGAADRAYAQALVTEARLHDHLAAALERLRAAAARIAGLEAQNAALRARLGTEAAHG